VPRSLLALHVFDVLDRRLHCSRFAVTTLLAQASITASLVSIFAVTSGRLAIPLDSAVVIVIGLIELYNSIATAFLLGSKLCISCNAKLILFLLPCPAIL